MPVSLDWQIERGAIVCPQTHEPLRRAGANLESSRYTYPIVGDIPLLLVDQAWARRYAAESAAMTREYRKNPVITAVRTWFLRDWRPRRCWDALHSVCDIPADSLGISVGGGPFRVNDQFVNLNIGPFRNVDVVGDAHLLPYASGSVDAVHCEAVLEHLTQPQVAAAEIFRVLKPGGRAYFCTPFLQTYHGFPHHYQNFTLSGHTALFQQTGFEVEDSGVCAGPVYTLFEMLTIFSRNYFPFPLNRVGSTLCQLGRAVLGPIDLLLAKHRNAYVMASTTYAVVRKSHQR